MPQRADRKPVLPYRAPAGNPRRPPWFAEIGCASSPLGAILFGVIFPCGGFNSALHDPNGPGGLLFWPFAMIVGGIVGAVVAPVCVLGIYWLSWRLAGRP